MYYFYFIFDEKKRISSKLYKPVAQDRMCQMYYFYVCRFLIIVCQYLLISTINNFEVRNLSLLINKIPKT